MVSILHCCSKHLAVHLSMAPFKVLIHLKYVLRHGLLMLLVVFWNYFFRLTVVHYFSILTSYITLLSFLIYSFYILLCIQALFISYDDNKVNIPILFAFTSRKIKTKFVKKINTPPFLFLKRCSLITVKVCANRLP